MTTLITGVAGFIGFHTARALIARGESVIGIDSLNDYYDVGLKNRRLAELQATKSGQFSFERVDFSDHLQLDAALAKHDFAKIIHLGAQAGVRYSIEKPRAYIQSNLVGHLNLLEVARCRRVVNFVYASSSSVYGGNKNLPFRVEDRVDQPLSLYAATKKSDELISETYSHLYRLSQTGLRFFTVYGPWGRPDMAMWIFTQRILAGEAIPVFNFGRMRRDFTYVDDIVKGVIACHDNPAPDDDCPKPGGSVSPHRIYNIGNHRSEDLMRMIGIIEECCGTKAKMDFLPMQPGDVDETYADISAIQRDLEFVPATTIDEGVPRFVRWYRDYHGI